MTLTYYVSECLNDSSAYNIRCLTKKECRAKMKDHNKEGGGARYGSPHKVTVEYSSGFDLLCQCLGEGSIYEGE